MDHVIPWIGPDPGPTVTMITEYKDLGAGAGHRGHFHPHIILINVPVFFQRFYFIEEEKKDKSSSNTFNIQFKCKLFSANPLKLDKNIKFGHGQAVLRLENLIEISLLRPL